VLTLEQTAERLGIAVNTVRRLIEEKVLPANQVVPCAPWQIPAEALVSEPVLQAIADIKKRVRRPRSTNMEGQRVLFSAV
jgi:excisionase family DNA binding protein